MTLALPACEWAFDPAALFDALVYGSPASAAAYYESLYEVVAAPGRPLVHPIRPGDVLVCRALGERSAARVFVVVGDDPLNVRAEGIIMRGGEGVGDRLVAKADGIVLRDRLVVRPAATVVVSAPVATRVAPPAPAPMPATPAPALPSWPPHHPPPVAEPVHEPEPEPGPGPDVGGERVEQAATCTPAPEAHPARAGARPLVERYGGPSRNRRPVVGYAQICLNNWLTAHQAGRHQCRATDPSTTSFITRQLDIMRRNGQLPLTVDCRFGPSTEAATKAFQACMGIQRDGRIGWTETWPRLEDFAVLFSLRVDADRNGTLVDPPQTWTWGASGRGAVVLVNNDDDDVRGGPDNADGAVDGGNDTTELAPLAVDRTGAATTPTGTAVELVVDRPDAVRVFSARTGGAATLVGPSTAGGSAALPDLTSARVELGMEGLRYAGSGFTGEVRITLRQTGAGGNAIEHSTVVRVAPWMMAHHLVTADRVYVAERPITADFRNGLQPLAGPAGFAVQVVPATGGDIWVQDCMEFGSANLPSTALRSVMRSAQTRGLDGLARSLLDADLGFTAEGSNIDMPTFDSTGNLEVTPPVTTTKDYPFGRIYFCPGDGVEFVNPDVRAFLERQVVQEPFELDAAWLNVGHVDETVSFVPGTTGRAWRAVVPSPRRAYEIFDAVRAADPAATVLTGRSLRLRNGSTVSVEQRVDRFLSLPIDFHPDGSGHAATAGQSLRDYNDAKQADVNRVKATLRAELGLADADFIELPVVFMPNPRARPIRTTTTADAFTSNVVNMIVANGTCIVPEPFGPVQGGTDRFRADVESKLQAVGSTVRFVDSWEYHVRLGEAHCATNTLRRADAARWWEFQP
jgi:peptidoglycan hydrolase-like protein with peptidoglycan-binding domain